MVDLYRARVTLTNGTVSALMTTYWTTSAPTPDNATATEALARVRAMLNSAAAQIASGTTTFFDTNVQIIDDATGTLINQATGASPAAVTYTAAGDVMPGQTQGLARLVSPVFVGGRQVKGRLFLPFTTESLNASSGTPTSAYATAWNTALGLLSTTIVTPISQAIWHRPKGKPPTGGQAVPIASRSTAFTWAVLKSRRS